MLTIGRLKYGDLFLSGEIDERLPKFVDDLYIHYPFDFTLDGRDYNRKRNLLNIEEWKCGSFGSQGSFSALNPFSYMSLENEYTEYTGINGISISKNDNYIAIVHVDEPYFSLLKREGNSISLVDTYMLPGVGRATSFSPNGDYIAIIHDESPYFTLLKRTEDTLSLSGTFELPNAGNSISFSSDGNRIAITDNEQPEVVLLGRDGDNVDLVTTYALPGIGRSVSFSPDGEYIAVGHDGDPYFTLLKIDGNILFAVDTYGLPGPGNCVSFSPNGKYVAISHGGSPYFTLLSRNRDKVALFDTYEFTGVLHGVSFSPDSKYIIVGHESPPYLSLLKIGDSGVSLVDSYTLPGFGYNTVFFPDNQYILVINTNDKYLTLFRFDDIEKSNQIVRYVNPSGNIDSMWLSSVNKLNDQIVGGWQNFGNPIDPSKTYRMSVWIRREEIGDGVTYFGPQPLTVSKLGEDEPDMSPVFIKLTRNKIRSKNARWLLLVAHIRPSNFSEMTRHPQTGIYDSSGRKIYSKVNDYKWLSDSTYSGHRVYLKGPASVGGKHYFYRPRIEVVESNSPTIIDLINDMEDTVRIPDDYTNENISFTIEGLGLHEPTQNLIPDPLFNGEPLTDALDPNWSTVDYPEDVNRVVNYKRIMRYHYFDGSYSQVVSIKSKGDNNDEIIFKNLTEGFSVGDTITFSAYVKTNSTNKVRLTIGFLNTDGEEIDSAIESEYLSIINKFQRLSVTGEIPENTATVRLMIRGIDEIGEYMEVYLPQCENIPFMTSPTVNIRGIASCKIPFRLEAPYTIHIDLTPSAPNDIDRYINVLHGDSVSTKLAFWKDEEENTYRIRINGDGSNEFVIPSDMVYGGNRSKVAIVVGKETSSVYIDGELLGTKNILGSSQYIEYLDLTSNGNPEAVPNHVIHSLSIYDRELTADEVGYLIDGDLKLRMYADGSINAKLVEKSFDIPDDAYYYPLADSPLDENLIFNPSINNNITFNRGYAWALPQISQLFETYDDSNIFSENVGDQFKTYAFEDDLVIYKYDFHKEFTNYKGNSISLEENKTYFFSVDVFVSSDYNGDYNEFVRLDDYIEAGLQYDLNRKGSWQRLTTSFTTESSRDIKILLSPCYQNNSATRGYIVYKNPMFTNTIHEVPFNTTLIEESKLEFNLHGEIGLDWSSDWSIIYWKIPKGTHVQDLSGYNVDTLGKYGNTIGGGYKWWGKNNGADVLSVRGIGQIPIDISRFFNKPHMVSIIKNGQDIKWKFCGLNDVGYEFSQTMNITSPNYFVCENGYDLKLGGYNTTTCPAMYRNLVVLKRALDEDVVEKIFNRYLRSVNSGTIHIPGTLSDGYVF